MTAAFERTCKWKFEALPSYFFDYIGAAQHHATSRATTLPLLGLIDQPFTFGTDLASGQKSWQRFAAHVEWLNEQSPNATIYKVLYITRHGLGYHNVYEAQVGRGAWNNKWSHLDGDGNITWADSQLNTEGIEQAKALGQFWSKAITEEALPVPESIYTSPLARCLETTRLVLGNAVTKQGRPFRPVVKEALRERITDHTCDRRSSRSWIEANYSECVVEPGMTEEDSLWSGKHWESAEEHEARKQQLLEDVFENDPNTFISLTTHSYAISAILGAVGLPQFRVSEGSSIALLVRGEKIGTGASRPHEVSG